MHHEQLSKTFMVTAPGALVDDASLTTVEIDTLGYDACEIIVIQGATDIAMTALAVTESDTSASGHANITGLVWGTSNNIDGSASTLPSATDDGLFQIAQINLAGRKRYLDVTATVGDGSVGGYYAVIARLSRAEESPTTIAQFGANEVLRV